MTNPLQLARWVSQEIIKRRLDRSMEGHGILGAKWVSMTGAGKGERKHAQSRGHHVEGGGRRKRASGQARDMKRGAEEEEREKMQSPTTRRKMEGKHSAK